MLLPSEVLVSYPMNEAAALVPGATASRTSAKLGVDGCKPIGHARRGTPASGRRRRRATGRSRVVLIGLAWRISPSPALRRHISDLDNRIR